MDTNWCKYDNDILIRLNLRASKIYVLDIEEMCFTPYKCGILGIINQHMKNNLLISG